MVCHVLLRLASPSGEPYEGATTWSRSWHSPRRLSPFMGVLKGAYSCSMPAMAGIGS